MTLAGDAWHLARKDLRVEARTLQSTASVLTLSGAALVLVGLLIGPAPERLRDMAPAVAWIVLLYSAIAVAERLDRIDRADDAFSGFWLALDDRRAIYVGRVASLACLLTLLQVAIWAASAVLLDLRVAPESLLILPLSALTALSAASAIALVSPLVAGANHRALLLPVLLLPLLVPTFLAAVQASTALFAGRLDGAVVWVAALIVQASLFAGVGLLTYETAARPA